MATLPPSAFYGKRAAPPPPPPKAPSPPRRKRAREDALTRWSAFRRQDEALAHAQASGGGGGGGGEEPRVWAHELAKTGVRSYIVASVRDFWCVYRTLRPVERRHYELIEPSRPCRLYFDLEFRLGGTQPAEAQRAEGGAEDGVEAQAGAGAPAAQAPRRPDEPRPEAEGTSGAGRESPPPAPSGESEEACAGGAAAAPAPAPLSSACCEVAMACFWRLLQAELRDGLGLALLRHGCVELDSSSAAKFSRHVTLSLARPRAGASGRQQGEAEAGEEERGTPDEGEAAEGGQQLEEGEVLFESNAAAGAWVRGWVDRMRAQLHAAAAAEAEPAEAGGVGSPAARPCALPPCAAQLADIAQLFRPAEGCAEGAPSAECLVDVCVYSRHRCFRLYGSSKVGKGTPLLPLGLSPQAAARLPLRQEAELFGRSLVCPPRGTPTAAPLIGGGKAAAEAAAGGAARRPPSAADGAAGGWLLPAQAAALGGAALGAGAAGTLAQLRAFAACAWRLKSGRPCEVGQPRLAPPAHAADGACVSQVSVCLPVLHNRWCGRVRREHRSNGVYLHARASRPPGGGRALGCVSQRCHDLDCRDFRGDELPMPEQLAAELLAALGEGGGRDAGEPPTGS